MLCLGLRSAQVLRTASVCPMRNRHEHGARVSWAGAGSVGMSHAAPLMDARRSSRHPQPPLRRRRRRRRLGELCEGAEVNEYGAPCSTCVDADGGALRSRVVVLSKKANALTRGGRHPSVEESGTAFSATCEDVPRKCSRASSDIKGLDPREAECGRGHLARCRSGTPEWQAV